MQTPDKFHSLTRLNDDCCSIQSRDMRSVGPGFWALGERKGVASIQTAATTALDNPTVTYGVGYGTTVPAVIDDESILKNHQISTHNGRCATGSGRIQPRPFTTVPYMGRGRGSPDVESVLQHSLIVRCGRECGDVTDGQWPVFTPLIPKLAETVQNPRNLVQEVAQPGWIRPGLPSRLYARDNCV